MKIIRDPREWRVNLTLDNNHCPFLCFPANYHGCRLQQNGEEYCTFESCPKRLMAEAEVSDVVQEGEKEEE